MGAAKRPDEAKGLGLKYLRERQNQTRPWPIALKAPKLLEELRHSQSRPIHPLWTYLPADQRNRRTMSRLRRQRLLAWLKQRRQRILLVLSLYVLIWSIPLLFGEPLMTVFAYLPLVLVPPVGYLVYWLVWTEFNA